MNTHENPEQLSAYVDEALSHVEKLAVETHLTACPECRRDVAALRATVSELRALEHPVPPQPFELRAAIARARGRTARVGRLSAALAGSAAAITAIVFLAMGGNNAAKDSAGSALQRATSFLTTSTVDYNEATAAALLSSGESTAFALNAQDSARTKHASGDAYVAEIAADRDKSAAFARCDESGFATASPRPTAEQVIAATFKRAPAFLAVYTFPDDGHRELWVFRQSDCFVLYFKQ